MGSFERSILLIDIWLGEYSDPEKGVVLYSKSAI